MCGDWEMLTHEVKLQWSKHGGFVFVHLLDLDDRRRFQLGEDEILALHRRLGEIIQEEKL